MKPAPTTFSQRQSQAISPDSGHWAGRLRGRLRTAFTTLVRWFPWTPLGVLVCAGSAWSLWGLAYAQFDVVWLVLAYVVATLALLAPLCVLSFAVILAVRGIGRDDGEHLALETGGERTTGFSLPALSWLPMVQLRWHWIDPPGVEVLTDVLGGRRHERVRFDRRGRIEGFTRLLRIEDPFGLARITLVRPTRRSIDILPHLGSLAQVPSFMSYASGDDLPHPMGVDDGDRVELSRYVPGDPARFIHWKVFARTRQLMVRRPERALSVARRVAAFMVAGPDDDASAAIARLALGRGLLGDEWRFGTDGQTAGTGRVDEAMIWLCESAQFDARGGHGLPAFIKGVVAAGPASFILFVPARPGPWLSRVIECAGSQRLRVLVGTDGVSAAPTVSRWRRVLLRGDRAVSTTERQLDEVVHTLASAGCDVTVMDRRAGRVLTEQHRRAMVAHAEAGAA